MVVKKDRDGVEQDKKRGEGAETERCRRRGVHYSMAAWEHKALLIIHHFNTN